MRYSLLVLAGILSACSSNPRAENRTGLPTKIEAVKNHGEGADVSLALRNTSRETIRLPAAGSVSLWLDGNGPIKGHLTETVVVAPGERAKFKAKFEFINTPKIYKKAVVEIQPQKVFRTCRAADADPDVVKEEKNENREPAMEVEALTCDRPLKRPIRLEY